LERQSNALGLTDVVDFLGLVDPGNIPELMNKTTIVLVPSRPGDSFPLVAIQAAQMARPLVAARVGGLPELIMHRQTGLLIEEENIEELVEAVTFLLENPERAVRYGQAGRKQAQELFSLDKCVNAYDVLYRKLSGNLIS
jgi:glycogen(starch) synthase